MTWLAVRHFLQYTSQSLVGLKVEREGKEGGLFTKMLASLYNTLSQGRMDRWGVGNWESDLVGIHFCKGNSHFGYQSLPCCLWEFP